MVLAFSAFSAVVCNLEVYTIADCCMTMHTTPLGSYFSPFYFPFDVLIFHCIYDVVPSRLPNLLIRRDWFPERLLHLLPQFLF